MSGPPVTDAPSRPLRSERFLAAVAPFERIVVVSHVNPDPDALASMLGLQALLTARRPEVPVTLAQDGLIARAENQAMVHLLDIPLVPQDGLVLDGATGVVMVDTQPRNTGRIGGASLQPQVVLDHHETPGALDGVRFRDIQPRLGATSTMVTGYLIEQGLGVDRRLATALLYGIESEISGYPRESSPTDDGALVWLFPRADKDLLARIRNPRLPLSYFATFHQALANSFLYRDAIVTWCGAVPHAEIIAELADFLIRFDRVAYVLTLGHTADTLKLSLRSDHIGSRSGEILRAVVGDLGTAGGHDKRAGGAIELERPGAEPPHALLTTLRERFLAHLGIDAQQGQRLLESCPLISVP
jgi:nanoRNase/pAp phosphatase (c-di-AMP/oligoRNAs hydrolase)